MRWRRWDIGRKRKKKKKKKKKGKRKTKRKERINITASRVLTNHNTNVTRARFASPIGREGALSWRYDRSYKLGQNSKTYSANNIIYYYHYDASRCRALYMYIYVCNLRIPDRHRCNFLPFPLTPTRFNIFALEVLLVSTMPCTIDHITCAVVFLCCDI